MIIIDQRESRCTVPRKLEELKVPVIYDTLEIGDYVICGREEKLVIERKDANDYLGSMISGHLNNQLLEMSTNYSISILIVEGFITEALMTRQMPRLNYNANLAHVITRRSPNGKSGLPSVVCLDTQSDTAYFLKSLNDVMTTENLYFRTFVLETKKNKRNPALSILATFHNVGENRAKLLLEHFNWSLKRVLNADESELCQVEGIGKMIAHSIKKTYNGEIKE